MSGGDEQYGESVPVLCRGAEEVGGFVGQAFEEFANSSKRDFARPAVAVIVRHEVTNQKKIGIS